MLRWVVVVAEVEEVGSTALVEVCQEAVVDDNEALPKVSPEAFHSNDERPRRVTIQLRTTNMIPDPGASKRTARSLEAMISQIPIYDGYASWAWGSYSQ